MSQKSRQNAKLTEVTREKHARERKRRGGGADRQTDRQQTERGHFVCGTPSISKLKRRINLSFMVLMMMMLMMMMLMMTTTTITMIGQAYVSSSPTPTCLEL